MDKRIVGWVAWLVLTGSNAGICRAAADQTETLESPVLRIELSTNPYSYRVVEKSSAKVLLRESGAITFTSNASMSGK